MKKIETIIAEIDRRERRAILVRSVFAALLVAGLMLLVVKLAWGHP